MEIQMFDESADSEVNVQEIKKFENGFDGLISGLKNRMVVGEMRPTKGRDYEHDLTAWVQDENFVKYVNQTLKVEIWSKDGRRMNIEPGVTKLPSNLEEAKTNESKLLGIAMSIAKLDLIKEVIDDVYPTLGSEAKEYLLLLEKMKDEVLGVSEQEDKANSLIDKVPVSYKKMILLFNLLLAACLPSMVPPVKAEILPQQPAIVEKIEVGEQSAEMTAEEQRQHVEDLLNAGGTSIVVGTPTSEYVQGETPLQATFEEIVSQAEINGNGVDFSHIDVSEIREHQLLSGEKFAYLTSVIVDGKTMVTFDFFTNPDLADYLLTREGQLNFFLVNGDETVAKENVRGWCLAGDRVCMNVGNAQ